MERLGWPVGLTWTMSPEVELGGHDLRVMISYRLDAKTPTIRVLVNNEQIHPGGAILRPQVVRRRVGAVHPSPSRSVKRVARRGRWTFVTC